MESKSAFLTFIELLQGSAKCANAMGTVLVYSMQFRPPFDGEFLVGDKKRELGSGTTAVCIVDLSSKLRS